MKQGFGALMIWLAFFLPSALAAQTTSAESQGLYTEEQADRGEDMFDRTCGHCHGSSQFSGSAFMRVWEGVPVGQFYQLVRSTMPQDAPASFAPNQYADIIAYLLSRNELPAGDAELPADPEALMEIRIEEPGSEPDSAGAGPASAQPRR